MLIFHFWPVHISRNKISFKIVHFHLLFVNKIEMAGMEGICTRHKVIHSSAAQIHQDEKCYWGQRCLLRDQYFQRREMSLRTKVWAVYWEINIFQEEKCYLGQCCLLRDQYFPRREMSLRRRKAELSIQGSIFSKKRNAI